MDTNSFITFDNYKLKLISKVIDNRSMEEVLKEAEEISLKVSKKRGE